MRKYFYTDGVDKKGPFSFEELKNESINRETKIWFFGLDDWKKLSEIEELKSLCQLMPPSLLGAELKKVHHQNYSPKSLINRNDEIKSSKTKNIRIGIIVLLSICVLFICYFSFRNQNDKALHDSIAKSAFETDVDFDFYMDKFYRDIEANGLFPKKPKKIIIKFGKLDQINDATHMHGISYGSGDDNLIEIYINPSTWKKFNKTMRYWLIYHELSHDVLNLDDLDDSPKNEGKLMYPSIGSYEYKTMDDFIESSHALFEEVSGNKIF